MIRDSLVELSCRVPEAVSFPFEFTRGVNSGFVHTLQNFSKAFPRPNSQISKAMKFIFILKPHNNKKALFSTIYFITF